MSGTPDELYNLLPAIYLQKDAERGFPLRALFATLQAQHDLLRQDIGALYQDWFVETCEPWLLPYIGQLVAAGRLGNRSHPGMDTRALVANTLAYRRRKGLPAVLESALALASGWPTRVVESRALVAMTAAAGRSGSTLRATVDVRRARAIANLGGAFDQTPRSARVSGRGVEGLGRIGVWQWRLLAYPMCGIEAGRIAGHRDRRTFHPFGIDSRLFNRPVTRAHPAARAGRRDLPLPLRRDIVALDLADALNADDGPLSRDNLFHDEPAFRIHLGQRRAPVAPGGLVIADLSAWRRPRAAAAAKGRVPARVAVDPELGRILLLDPADVSGEVVTNHARGFSGDIGGGPYPRPGSPTPSDRRDSLAWLSDIWSPTPGRWAFNLIQALGEWSAQLFDGLIEIPDSSTWRGEASIALGGGGARNLVVRARTGECPTIIGDLAIGGGPDGGTLILDGLAIRGSLRITGNVTLIARNCTIMPADGDAAIRVAADPVGAGVARIVLDGSIVAALRVPAQGVRLEIRDSIVDGRGEAAVSGVDVSSEGPVGVIESATIHGDVAFRRLEASNSLFLGALRVADVRAGYVRHALVPPDFPLDAAYACVVAPGGGGAGAARFVSRRFGDPGYFQFAEGAGQALLTGASDGQAIGAFHRLGDTVRLESFDDALTEYAPYGLTIVRHRGS